jgi:hypothetical protein
MVGIVVIFVGRARAVADISRRFSRRNGIDGLSPGRMSMHVHHGARRERSIIGARDTEPAFLTGGSF